jgi:hypothetical protein
MDSDSRLATDVVGYKNTGVGTGALRVLERLLFIHSYNPLWEDLKESLPTRCIRTVFMPTPPAF